MEDFVYPETRVFIDQKSPFSVELNNFCKKNRNKILFTASDGVNIWIRDYFVKSKDTVYFSVRPKNLKSNQTNIFSENDNLKYMYFSSSEPVCRYNFLKKSDFNNYVNKLKSNYVCKSNYTDLEGGNLISAKNSKNEFCYIIGNNSIAATLYRNKSYNEFNPKKSNDDFYIEKLSKNFSINDRPYLDTKMNLDWKNAKERIVSLFSPSKNEKIIFIPHWAYHIDLQMSYIGNSIILLHSFKETIEFYETNKEIILKTLIDLMISKKTIFNYKEIQKNYGIYRGKTKKLSGNSISIYDYIQTNYDDLLKKIKQELDFNLRKIMKYNLDNFEKNIIEIENTLTANGFKVLKFCGLFPLAQFSNGKIDQKNHIFNNDIGLNFLFLLTNSIPFQSDTKTTTILVPGDKRFFGIAYDYFTKFLSNKIISSQKYICEFIKCTNESLENKPEHTMEYISDKEGALRCQTNINIDGNPISKI